MAAKRKKTCLVRRCKRAVRARGLCDACYRAAKRKVQAEETTWDELESHKLAHSQRRRSPFHQALEKATT